jgi:hypothetical protein
MNYEPFVEYRKNILREIKIIKNNKISIGQKEEVITDDISFIQDI